MLVKSSWFAALLASSLTPFTHAQNDTETPLSIGVVIFPGFTPLDIWGPLEILYAVSGSHPITLSTISFRKGIVDSRTPAPFTQGPNDTKPFDPSHVINPQMIATHSFDDAPAHLDVLLVPGGAGDFLLDNQNNLTMEKFVASRAPELKYLLSVCTGAVTLARAGLLKGRRATTNKRAWAWATHPRQGEGIEWVPSARWVVDGNVWTSSGVAAGMDMVWAWVGEVWGFEVANGTVNGIEYTPHVDPHWDAFSVVHKVPGANTNQSLTDCLRPVGY